VKKSPTYIFVLLAISILLFIFISTLSASISLENSEDEGYKPLEATFQFDILPNKSEVRLQINLNAEDESIDKINGKYAIKLSSADSYQVIKSEGFESKSEVITWDKETRNSTIVIEYSPNMNSDHYGTDNKDWILSRIRTSSTWNSNVEEKYLPNGIRGGEMVLLGDYDVERSRFLGQELNLVIPNSTSLKEDPEKVMDALEFGSSYFRVGSREDNYFAFVTEDPIQPGGLALQNNLDTRVHSDSTINGNTWLHEYYHTRQNYTPIPVNREGQGLISMRWLTEGEARYFQRLTSYKLGSIKGQNEKEKFREFLRRFESAKRYNSTILAKPHTWDNRFADYQKGSKVVAALDQIIRNRTSGKKTYLDLVRKLNNKKTVNYSQYKTEVEYIVGKDMSSFFDSYVLGSDLPELSDRPSIYQRNNRSIEYNITIKNKTKKLEVGQKQTYQISIKNTGQKVSIKPNIRITGAHYVYEQNKNLKSISEEYRDSLDYIEPGQNVERNITVVPSNTGQKNIRVTIEDVQGNINNKSASVIVSKPSNLNAQLLSNQTVVPVNEQIKLDGSVSSSNKDIEIYEWDLNGDGFIEETTKDPYINTSFNDSGFKKVYLNVIDSKNRSERSSIELTVNDYPKIEIKNTIVLEKEDSISKSFEPSIKNKIGSYNVYWDLPHKVDLWNDKTYTRRYSKSGIYNLRVFAEDKYGLKRSKSIKIIVKNKSYVPNCIDENPICVLQER
jgi:hypothetical protein